MTSSKHFYFDYLSPYSYFLFKKLEKNSSLWKDVVFKPIILAKILNHWGQKGPAEIEPKRLYLFRHAMRVAAREKFPFSPPLTHPFNPLYALRLSCLQCAQEHQFNIIKALWSYTWESGCTPDDPEKLALLLSNIGLKGEEILERSYLKATKDELLSNTQEAINKGCFGVPTITVGEELFWGQDSYEDMKDYIQGNDPLNRSKYLEVTQQAKKGAGQKLDF
jgi:2-hydroxychromene-2-carboxylate isomerase